MVVATELNVLMSVLCHFCANAVKLYEVLTPGAVSSSVRKRVAVPRHAIKWYPESIFKP